MTNAESGKRGSVKGLAQRRAEKAAGMAAARAFRAQRHPVPAVGHMPFAGHRTQAELTNQTA